MGGGGGGGGGEWGEEEQPVFQDCDLLVLKYQVVIHRKLLHMFLHWLYPS